MSLNTRKLFSTLPLLFACGYFLSFIIYYVSNYLLITDVTAYIWLFVNRLTYLLFPLITAVSVFAAAPFIGSRKALFGAVGQVAARILYFVPYFYLKYIVEGFSSIECLGIGLILSLGEAVLTFLAVALIYTVMKIILERGGADKKAQIFEPTRLDFGSMAAIAIAVPSALASVYFLIGEIADTVSFIIDYGFDFNTPEIIFLTISYIFDILIAPVYFFVLAYVKNRVISLFGYIAAVAEEKAEEKN